MTTSAQVPTPPVTGSADLNFSRLDADVGDGHSAFLQHILDSSTEYSIIGKDLDGNILLWNEGGAADLRLRAGGGRREGKRAH